MIQDKLFFFRFNKIKSFPYRFLCAIFLVHAFFCAFTVQAQHVLQHQIDSLTSSFNHEFALLEAASPQGDSTSAKLTGNLIDLTSKLAKSYWMLSYSFSTPNERKETLEKGIAILEKTKKLKNNELIRGLISLLEVERLPLIGFEEKFTKIPLLKSEIQNLVFQYPHQNEGNIAYSLLFQHISQLNFFERALAKYWYKVQLPEPVSPDIEIIFLLQAKVDGAYPAFVHYKLAETYIKLYNFLGIEESLNQVLSVPNEYPYLDDHYKKLAFDLKAYYKTRGAR
ncbi:MAG: hypothetical protein SFU91_07960 [Chloroherpetonaceae bacterium]|nr:hypothetical protein [Chloroherpetonaceae bacterium]